MKINIAQSGSVYNYYRYIYYKSGAVSQDGVFSVDYNDYVTVGYIDSQVLISSKTDDIAYAGFADLDSLYEGAIAGKLESHTCESTVGE